MDYDGHRFTRNLLYVGASNRQVLRLEFLSRRKHRLTDIWAPCLATNFALASSRYLVISASLLNVQCFIWVLDGNMIFSATFNVTWIAVHSAPTMKNLLWNWEWEKYFTGTPTLNVQYNRSFMSFWGKFFLNSSKKNKNIVFQILFFARPTFLRILIFDTTKVLTAICWSLVCC